MGKLKKFKILEKGRICTPEELNELKGGKNNCDYNYVTCMSGYMTCNELGYRSCKPTSLSGYTSNGSNTYCDSGYTYNQCVVGIQGYDTCASSYIYKN